MGAFLIVNKSSFEDSKNVYDSINILKEMGFSHPIIIENKSFKFYIYKKLIYKSENLFFEDNLNFIFSTGTLFFENHAGLEAIKKLFSQFKIKGVKPELIEQLSGNYCLVISIDGMVFVLSDRLGIYHTYANEDFSAISNSFLSVSQLTRSKTINIQAVTEYILTGVIYGGDTYINEVRHLSKNKIYNISKRNSISKNAIADIDYKGENIDYFTDRFSCILRRVFQDVKSNFQHEKVHSALTAGYDSRLMLAAMRNIDFIPSLYVYDNGTPDLVISSQIAKNLNFSLRQYKFLDYPTTKDVDEAVQLLRKSFYMNDGKNDSGVFYQGFDWLMRQNYFEGAQIHMNGFGGELLRNSYGVHDRPIKFSDFFKIRYDRLNYNSIVKLGDKQQYFSRLQDKFSKEIDLSGNTVSRKDVQKLLALNHYQYWGGTNQSLKGRYTHSFTPLMDIEFVLESFRIPMKYRNHGLLNRKLISSLDVQLAKQTSNYGYNFYDGPDLKQKLQELIRIHIPLNLRPYLRRYLRKNNTKSKASIFNDDVISKLFNKDKFFLKEYFYIENVESQNMLSRLYTVEYYIREYFR